MMNKPDQTPKKDTTIQISMDLKNELDALKVDDKETYGGVIRRIVNGQPQTESTEETVNLTLPRKLYRMLVMVLPENITDQVRKGVR